MDLEINELCDQVKVVFEVILLFGILMIELVNAVVLFVQLDGVKCDNIETRRIKSSRSRFQEARGSKKFSVLRVCRAKSSTELELPY